MKPTPKNRCQILTSSADLSRPDADGARLLVFNTILSQISELVEHQTRQGTSDPAAESWAEIASDVVHRLPKRTAKCAQTGKEVEVFRNSRNAFPLSINPRIETSDIPSRIKWMAQAARATCQSQECDHAHVQLAQLLAAAHLPKVGMPTSRTGTRG